MISGWYVLRQRCARHSIYKDDQRNMTTENVNAIDTAKSVTASCQLTIDLLQGRNATIPNMILQTVLHQQDIARGSTRLRCNTDVRIG
jgi:hypothetical protein